MGGWPFGRGSPVGAVWEGVWEGAGQTGPAEGLRAACSGGGGRGSQRAGESIPGELGLRRSWGLRPHCARPVPGCASAGGLLRPCWWLWGNPGSASSSRGMVGARAESRGLVVRGQLRASWRWAAGGFRRVLVGSGWRRSGGGVGGVAGVEPRRFVSGQPDVPFLWR